MPPRRRHLLNVATGNYLLAGLPEPEMEWLDSRCARVPLDLRQVLYRQGDRIDRLYFPDSGAISLISVTAEGKSVQIGIVGTEGVVGAHAMYGPIVMPCEAVVQAAGQARVLYVNDLWENAPTGGRLMDLLGLYLHMLLIQTIQTAGCNRLHSIRQRAARWILTMHDRVGTEYFGLTQELLGVMLGARRQSVSDVARDLQKAGIIQYRRGRMTIRNRSKLEAAACECYGITRDVRDQFARSLPPLALRQKAPLSDERGELVIPSHWQRLRRNYSFKRYLSSSGQISGRGPWDTTRAFSAQVEANCRQ